VSAKASSYLEYLPAIFQEGEDGDAFVGRFLKIFEKLLSGIDDLAPDTLPTDATELGYDIFKLPIQLSSDINPGIEQTIDKIHEFFDPELTPAEFLQWLAGWVALILREDWKPLPKRRLIKRIVPLYKKRGTKSGLLEYLRIFDLPNVQLDEDITGLYVGNAPGSEIKTAVGINTFVGGLLPHFFIVTIRFSEITSLGFIQEMINETKAIIDLEKPAHTYYALRFDFPGIYVGNAPGSEIKTAVGINTIIGRGYPVFV